MKVAAYQAPLLPSGSTEAIGLIRHRVEWCEAEGVAVLCCPEAVPGGLADDAACPANIAFYAGGGRLDAVLAPLASATVTTILGSVAGLYRKLHRRSENPSIEPAIGSPSSR